VKRAAALAVVIAIGIVVLLVITLHPGPPGGAGCGRPGPAHADEADQFAATTATARLLAPRLEDSVARAYQFLDQMMDLQTAGPARRLVQSYTGGLLGQQGDTSASIYDNALLIDAYLAEGTAAGVARAKTIGSALVYLQAHDHARDGRLRNGYTPAPLADANDIQATDPASSTGTLAWAGQALTQLYAATRIRAYLRSAIALGGWIQSQCRDGRGAGGYAGGDTAAGARIGWKSTEHNIDVFAFFRLLARETGNPVWSQRAAWARRFVVSMWDPAQGRFYLGTSADGVTRNDTAQVEDVNSWSYLALRDPAYAASVGWDVSSLSVPSGGYRGLSYCTGDRTGVWFEGTAQAADALHLRDQPRDSARARSYLADLGYAQAHGPNADGLGIMAASHDTLSDCQGGDLYASLHTGTTAWYILAAEGIDPLSGTPVARQAARR
jgi:hypothetical protein